MYICLNFTNTLKLHVITNYDCLKSVEICATHILEETLFPWFKQDSFFTKLYWPVGTWRMTAWHFWYRCLATNTCMALYSKIVAILRLSLWCRDGCTMTNIKSSPVTMATFQTTQCWWLLIDSARSERLTTLQSYQREKSLRYVLLPSCLGDMSHMI